MVLAFRGSTSTIEADAPSRQIFAGEIPILSSLFEPMGKRGVSPIGSQLAGSDPEAQSVRGKSIMPVIRRPPKNPEHREAVRLSWKIRHIPFGTIIIGGLALAGVLSAIFMVLALGPSNPPL